MSDPKDVLRRILEDGVRKLGGSGEVHLERPKNPEHGDWSTNVALQLAKDLKRKPREIAEDLKKATTDALVESGITTPAGVSIAGPGFFNVKLQPAIKLRPILEVLRRGKDYGRALASAPEKVQVEFVSANPTGPLHVGHGRQAALGDAIAALLESQGHKVTREYYYNDAGAQIDKLAWSVQARAKGIRPGQSGWPDEGYAGEYIEDIAREYKSDVNDVAAVRRFAVEYLRREQDADLAAFGVKFDVYYLESSLYTDGKVDEVVKRLVASGKTYEKEGALWLRTTDYGDDKDRVMRTSDGRYTYFVPDIAYHVTKWQRGFRRVVNVVGKDHASTMLRVRVGLQYLGIGIPKDWPEYVLHNMVHVMRGGKEVKMSKRSGEQVTMRELIDWAGRDAVRFFLVSRKADSEFVFDVDLARQRSDENPVYYVQYAHARVCSVLAQWGGHPATLTSARLDALRGEREAALASLLDEFPDTLAKAAREAAPHDVAFYLRELAAQFHSYYNAERILVDDEELRSARLALCAAVRQTLANGLSLIGVSAPEKM